MKKLTTLTALICLWMVSGCSGTKGYEEQIKDFFVKQSLIQEDEKYQTYVELAEDGALNEEGIYLEASKYLDEKTEDEEEQRSGQVHVTFAENSYLEIHYYKDPEYKEEIIGSCYLNPDDSVYAAIAESKHPLTNQYHFSGYRIYEHNNNGRKQLEWTVTDKDMVLQIPKDYSGQEISVVPVGEYENRTLSLNDYYVDDGGNYRQLSGNWTVDQNKTTDDSIEISPAASCIVSYEYDSSSYFFVSSNPVCRYQDHEDGIVIFEEANANSEVKSYSVELHPYLAAAIESEIEWTYQVNNGRKTEEQKKIQEITKLKYGDTIKIFTEDEAGFGYDEDKLTKLEGVPDGEGYCYTFQVKEDNARFYFDPAEYTYLHGSLIFRYLGNEIHDPISLGEGSGIQYEAAEMEEGYWLPDGDHTIFVRNRKETKEALNAIRFYPKKQVNVELAQPKAGGTVTYMINGSVVKPSGDGQMIQVYAGTGISMNFEGWEGWICSAEDNILYIVSEEPMQRTTAGGRDINKVFIEDERHKPELRLILDKSLGESLQMEVSASGYQRTGASYQKRGLKHTCILEAGKVGTEQGITVSLSNASVRSGYAVKLVLEKEDLEGNTTEEIRYMQKIPGLETFLFYDNNEIAKSAVYYGRVVLSASFVKTDIYEQKIMDHGMISLEDAETGKPVDEGDILDNDRKVTVRLIPESGYYVAGRNHIFDGVYSNTMTYKKYLSEIDRIIRDNPVKKICKIILDSGDSYGNVSYWLNGTEVSGEIEAKEGQKLALEYEITNPDYEIETKGLLKWIQRKNSKTVMIIISNEMDGKKIRREDYIRVKRKGN